MNFWEERYAKKETGWDIGYANPVLIDFVLRSFPKETKILIPGCGNGYEVIELVRLGYSQITCIDIANQPVQSLLNSVGSQAHIVLGDFFELKDSFDLILEQTFFCALNPTLRLQYVEKMHQLLYPAGTLAGLLFNVQFEKNPPFGGSKQEYLEIFAPQFEIRTLEPCLNSISPRLGSELFFEFKKK